MKKDDKQFLQANLQAAKIALASQKSYILFRTSPYFIKQELRQITKKFVMQGH